MTSPFSRNLSRQTAGRGCVKMVTSSEFFVNLTLDFLQKFSLAYVLILIRFFASCKIFHSEPHHKFISLTKRNGRLKAATIQTLLDHKVYFRRRLLFYEFIHEKIGEKLYDLNLSQKCEKNSRDRLHTVLRQIFTSPLQCRIFN